MTQKIKVVTDEQLYRAANTVWDELERNGFWNERIADVGVRLGTVGTWYGYHRRPLWRREGNGGTVVVPAYSLPRIIDGYSNTYVPLVDVVRHEYGHVVEYVHPHLMEKKSLGFEEAFGAPWGDNSGYYYDKDVHMTPYCATNVSEDFAEVFMYYLKYNGKLPKKYDNVNIRGRWEFVAKLARALV